MIRITKFEGMIYQPYDEAWFNGRRKSFYPMLRGSAADVLEKLYNHKEIIAVQDAFGTRGKKREKKGKGLSRSDSGRVRGARKVRANEGRGDSKRSRAPLEEEEGGEEE